MNRCGGPKRLFSDNENLTQKPPNAFIPTATYTCIHLIRKLHFGHFCFATWWAFVQSWNPAEENCVIIK